jgi:large subunit ribosomal protein L15
MIRLHNLKPRPGSRHRVKRLGIGESSGHGKTSGKGHKGQKARSGGSIRLGFEGGQMPLIRRLPKRGFNNAAFKKEYAIINLDDLNAFEPNATINEETLRQSKHIRGNFVGLKVLGRGELKHSLTIEADRVSEAAREKIEKAGGTVTLRERKQVAKTEESAEQAEKEATPAAKKKPGKKKPGKKKPAAKTKKSAQ